MDVGGLMKQGAGVVDRAGQLRAGQDPFHRGFWNNQRGNAASAEHLETDVTAYSTLGFALAFRGQQALGFRGPLQITEAVFAAVQFGEAFDPDIWIIGPHLQIRAGYYHLDTDQGRFRWALQVADVPS